MRSAGQAVAAIMGLAALSGCGGAGAPPGPTQPDGLVGAWRSHISASSGALAPMTDLAFMTVFNAGGTMTESSNYDGAPPVPPAYGVWRRTAGRTFLARYAFWVTKPPGAFADLAKGGGWAPNGYGVLTETITLAVDGRSYASTLTYAFFDAAGRPAPGGGAASGSGVRMGF
jgi:hypothetical protein